MKKLVYGFCGAVAGRYLLSLVMLSVLIECLIEVLGRHSFMSFLSNIASTPHIFLLNSLIVLCTFLPTLFAKRRAFALILTSVLWLGCGVANCVMMSLRGSPLTARDVLLLRDGLSIAAIYLSALQMILIGVTITAAIAGVIIAYLKLPKHSVKKGSRKAASIVAAAILAVTIKITVDVGGASEPNNTLESYEKLGFAYSFTRSVFSSGVRKPEEYSEAAVTKIMREITVESDVPEQRINVIFVQLESFFDPSEIKHLALSENPTPYFSSLKTAYPSGYLTVPVIGAGTVNTEFEVLTGLDLMHFGLGEYPYESILIEKTCESVAYNLRNLGYSAHAIHNHNRDFYARDVVYPNLGFERFIALEDMPNVQYTPTGWAKDEVLLDHILDSLELTDGLDFIFTVTAQGHGKYPEDFDALDFDVIENEEFEHINSGSFEYYLTQLSQTDSFIRNLLHTLEIYDEDVVTVLYGDHLPVLPITSDDLISGSLYMTEYVIWSNFGLDTADKNLDANELSAYVLSLLGLSEGVITKIHQYYENKDDRDEALRMIGYDMLYGERHYIRD